MIRVAKIDHLVLRSANVPAMVRFYEEVLGCRVERSLPPETGLTQLRAGDALIDCIVSTANGRLTAAEALGHREFVMTKLYRSA